MESFCVLCGKLCDACTFKIVRRVLKDKNGNLSSLLVVEPKCLDCADKDSKECLK